MKKCPNCNASLLDDAVFCEKCGNKLPEMKKCPKCGSWMELEDMFCTECGTQFANTSIPQNQCTNNSNIEEKVPETDPIVINNQISDNDKIEKVVDECQNSTPSIKQEDDDSSQTILPISSMDEPPLASTIEEEKNSNKLKIIVPVILVIFVVGIGGFYWWNNCSRNDNTIAMADTLVNDTVAVEEIEEDYGTFPTNPEAFFGDGRCFDLRGHAITADGMDLMLDKDGRIMVKTQEVEDSISTPDQLSDVKRNASGRLLSFFHSNEDGAYSLDFVYNNEGYVESIHGDIQSTEITYNKQGYIIKEKTIGPDDQESNKKFKYKEFDSHGNWIQRICIDDNGYEYVETREIKYYR